MKYPKTIRGKLSLLLKIAEMTAETENKDESIFFNNIIGFIQNELGDSEGAKILSRHGLKWNG